MIVFRRADCGRLSFCAQIFNVLPGKRLYNYLSVYIKLSHMTLFGQ